MCYYTCRGVTSYHVDYPSEYTIWPGVPRWFLQVVVLPESPPIAVKIGKRLYRQQRSYELISVDNKRSSLDKGENPDYHGRLEGPHRNNSHSSSLGSLKVRQGVVLQFSLFSLTPCTSLMLAIHFPHYPLHAFPSRRSSCTQLRNTCLLYYYLMFSCQSPWWCLMST